jgi:Flp pilus assembly CpaF family ATPase
VLPRLETLVLMAGAGLPLPAVRSQIGAAIDAVVHVTRSTAGARRVEAIGELAAGGDALDVRPLFERRGGELVPVGSPARAHRRPRTAAPEGRWFAC